MLLGIRILRFPLLIPKSAPPSVAVNKITQHKFQIFCFADIYNQDCALRVARQMAKAEK